MEIDFVVTWVDGGDPEWIRSFDTYVSEPEKVDIRKRRFRDWGLLRYLFRSFDSYAPWVGKVHFVTAGHFPTWLRTDNRKLNLVSHADFIDGLYLPLFNGRAIEMGLHKIPGISERFVYFNDDMFLGRVLGKDYFFDGFLPKDMCVFNAIYLDSIAHVRLNNIKVVDAFFDKHNFLFSNFFKVFNWRYGFHQIRSFLLAPWPQFTGFYDPHQPQPFLKKTFEEVWQKVPEVLHKTMKSRFRGAGDVNQYLFRYWQLLEGNFSPTFFSRTVTFPISLVEHAKQAAKAIRSGRCFSLCINDEIADDDDQIFCECKKIIGDAFDEILPEKSSYEV